MSARPAPALRPGRARPASHRPKTHLRVVRRKSRGLIKRSPARRAAPVMITAGIIMAAVVAGVLLEQVLMAQSAFKLGEIRTRLMAAEGRHNELMLEATRLEGDARIQTYAREVLGMTRADPNASVYIVAPIRAPGSDRLADLRRGAPATLQGTAAGSLQPAEGP